MLIGIQYILLSDICQISLLITMYQGQQVFQISLITTFYGTGIILLIASLFLKQKYFLENSSLLFKIVSLWLASQVQNSYIQNSLILWQLYAQTLNKRKNRIQPLIQLCQMIIHLFTIESVLVDNYIVFLLNLTHVGLFLVLLIRQKKKPEMQLNMIPKDSRLPSIEIRIPQCERQLVTNTTSTKRVLLPPNTILLSEDLKIIKSEFDLSQIIKQSNDQNQALEILLNLKLNCLFEQTQCQLLHINSWTKQAEQGVFSISSPEHLTHENTFLIINSKEFDGSNCYQIQFVKFPIKIEDDVNNSMELDMCRSLSHELGTNLNSIVTYIKMALNDEDIESHLKWKYLDPIRINSEQLNLIVGTIRDYNLIVLKQFSLKLEEIDVEQEAKFIVQLFNESIESKGINIQYNFTLDAVILVNDKQRFRQVLFQLIQNAVKYTFQSSILITISNDYFNCSISVTDNGIGMTEVECVNLNTLFTSGKFAKISEHSVGIGLGLGISNQLVKQMSGTNDSIQLTRLSKGCQFSFVIKNHQFDFSRELLRQVSSGIKGSSQNIRFISANTYVEDQLRNSTQKFSQFGRSQFHILSQQQNLLPFSSKKIVALQSQDQVKSDNESDEDEERINPPTFSPKFQKSIVQCSLNSECCARVLVVDDEYFNIQCLKLIMSKYQSKCDHAYNGQEAIQQVQRKKLNPCEKCGNSYYSLIFLDVNMPIMDGYQTVKELKRLMKQQEINKAWCVANTGFCDIDTKLKSYDSGMDFYLTKPLDQSLLREILQTMFPQKKF